MNGSVRHRHASSMIYRTLGALVLGACLAGCGGGSGEPVSLRSAGEIDTAFGQGGIQRLSYPASADDVRIDSQGRVLLASHVLNEALYSRVLPDGGSDPSLFRRTSSTLGSPHDAAVFPLAGGKLIGVLKGIAVIPGPGGVGHLAASRFDADGVLDPAYGTNGTEIFQTRSIQDVVGDADGSLVVLGVKTPLSSPTGAAQIARLDPAGRRVPLYERNAESALAACGDSVSAGYRGAHQPDARLVVAIKAAPDRWCVARLNADGTLDPGFGDGGRLQFPPPAVSGDLSSPLAVLIRPDGGITVVIASRSASVGVPERTVILWLTSAGRFDESRGNAGVSLMDGALLGPTVAAAIQADGKLLLVGYTTTDSTRPRIVRLDAQGRLDTAFGPSASGMVQLEAGGNRLLPKRVVATSAGAIYVAGGAVPAGPFNDLTSVSLAVMKLFTGER